MKIIIAIKSATLQLLKSWKGIIIVWFSSLILVSMIAVPMKGTLNSGLGQSMITEKLSDGINIEVFADLGEVMTSLVSFFMSGLFLLILSGFLLNAFLSGGIFNSLKGESAKFSAGDFFRASAKNFWSFLVILLIISIIVLVLALVIVVVPMSLVGNASVPEEGALLKTLTIVVPLFLLLLTIMLLVADYARAWQVSKEQNACFKALGFGFGQTFKTFFSSYPLMIILLVIHVLYVWFVLNILTEMKPVTGFGVFLLFLLSQFLFIIRIMLKVWRYGSVTSLMELNSYPSSTPQGGKN